MVPFAKSGSSGLFAMKKYFRSAALVAAVGVVLLPVGNASWGEQSRLHRHGSEEQ